MCRDSFLLSSGGSSGCQCNSGLQPVFLASQNARRGEQNAYVPDLAGVAELADALDSKSSGRKAVWVRAPPPASLTFSVGRWAFDVCSNELISLSLKKSSDASTSLSRTGNPDFRSLGPISHFPREQTAAAHNPSCCLCLYGSARTTMFIREREERPAG